ncbi:MAG: hypothetical protein ABSC89_12440 [Verrucomicrobiota bacterium]
MKTEAERQPVNPQLDWLALIINLFLISNDFMKQKLMVLAALLFAFGIHAALVEYSYTGKETSIGDGNQETYTYSGIMIYDTVSSNVTFVDWRKDKTYHFNTSTNLHFTTVTGTKSKTYTVITESASGTDTNEFYHLNDYMISGQNDTLQIAANTTFVFPKRFTGSNNRNISPDANGNAWLETWGETMTFSASRTKSDNNENLSSNEVVNTLVAKLQSKGYSER